jgi:hypothetical protein
VGGGLARSLQVELSQQSSCDGAHSSSGGTGPERGVASGQPLRQALQCKQAGPVITSSCRLQGFFTVLRACFFPRANHIVMHPEGSQRNGTALESYKEMKGLSLKGPGKFWFVSGDGGEECLALQLSSTAFSDTSQHFTRTFYLVTASFAAFHPSILTNSTQKPPPLSLQFPPYISNIRKEHRYFELPKSSSTTNSQHLHRDVCIHRTPHHHTKLLQSIAYRHYNPVFIDFDNNSE